VVTLSWNNPAAEIDPRVVSALARRAIALAGPD
jgi:hypothetical protein